jgi:hypothetical protein
MKPVELSVMTYNVEGLPWPIRSGRGDKLKAIGRELAALREKGLEPDVVLLQEGFRDEVEDLIKLSGYPHVARGPRKKQRDASLIDPRGPPALQAGEIPPQGRGLGQVGLQRPVGAEQPSDQLGQVARLSLLRGPGLPGQQGVMLVSLEVPGLPTPVEIADTHLNSKGASGVPRNRNRMAHHLQAEELGRSWRPTARRARP